MHNNDLSKDDFLEAFLEVLQRMKDWFFEQKKDGETKEIKVETKEEQLNKFKEIIKFIREQDLGKDVNRLLDFMEKNPQEALELISNAIKNELEKNVTQLKEGQSKLNDKTIEENKLIDKETKYKVLDFKNNLNNKIQSFIHSKEQSNEQLKLTDKDKEVIKENASKIAGRDPNFYNEIQIEQGENGKTNIHLKNTKDNTWGEGDLRLEVDSDTQRAILYKKEINGDNWSRYEESKVAANIEFKEELLNEQNKEKEQNKKNEITMQREEITIER